MIDGMDCCLGIIWGKLFACLTSLMSSSESSLGIFGLRSTLSSQLSISKTNFLQLASSSAVAFAKRLFNRIIGKLSNCFLLTMLRLEPDNESLIFSDGVRIASSKDLFLRDVTFLYPLRYSADNLGSMHEYSRLLSTLKLNLFFLCMASSTSRISNCLYFNGKSHFIDAIDLFRCGRFF